MRRSAILSLLVGSMIVTLCPGASAGEPTASSRGPEPVIRVANMRVTEGDSGVTTVRFVVTASRGAKASVDFRTKDGTAVDGLDYTGTSGTLHFTPRRTTRRIAVDVVGDQIDEPEETFRIRLTNAVGARIPDRTGRATIGDDDDLAGSSIAVGDAAAPEGQSAAFAVTLSAALSTPVTVDFATSDGSATAPDDYEATTGTLTFAPGQTVKQIPVPIVADAETEVDETFALTLSNAVGDSIGDGAAIGTITDDDTPAMSVANATVTEGNAGTVNALFSVTLSLPSAQTVSVAYATADGSATAPADYQATSGTLTFTPGQTVLQIAVPVVGDTVIESTEVFALNLSGAVNATLADPAAQGTITDNDTVSISVSNPTVTEGNAGTVNALFSVTLSASSSQTVSVAYGTADGSATAPADYQATSGTLTFTPGQTVLQIAVPVVGDTVIEATEVFSLNLSGAVNATLADPAAQGTINDNDTVSVSIGAATVTETNVGTRDAVFTISLSAVSGSTVTVDYATADGSAVAPGDYLTASGTVTFAPGEVTKQIVVQVVGDVLVEANETYSVNLSNPVNATIGGSGFGLGTITNND